MLYFLPVVVVPKMFTTLFRDRRDRIAAIDLRYNLFQINLNNDISYTCVCQRAKTFSKTNARHFLHFQWFSINVNK
jgi:hypothetical protein